MELYAWTKLLNKQIVELLDVLILRGNYCTLILKLLFFQNYRSNFV